MSARFLTYRYILWRLCNRARSSINRTWGRFWLSWRSWRQRQWRSRGKWTLLVRNCRFIPIGPREFCLNFVNCRRSRPSLPTSNSSQSCKVSLLKSVLFHIPISTENMILLENFDFINIHKYQLFELAKQINSKKNDRSVGRRNKLIKLTLGDEDIKLLHKSGGRKKKRREIVASLLFIGRTKFL